MSRQDPGAASGGAVREPGRCAECGGLETLHVLTRTGKRGSFLAAGCVGYVPQPDGPLARRLRGAGGAAVSGRTHLFELDPAGHAAHRGPLPCRQCPCAHCPLPYGNAVHEVPDTSEAQAEHLRRIGEDDL